MSQPKARLQALHDTIRESFRQGQDGSVLCRMMSDGVDEIVADLWRQHAPTASTCVDLVAVGGYGRAELAPFSDWDFWLLVPERVDEHVNEEIQAFLYALWDMGAKVGYAVRSVKESLEHIQNDWDAATASLESRLLDGTGEHYHAMDEQLESFFRRQYKKFVRVKRAEVEQRHLRSGDTAFLMEPDIKEGKGGLRDVQSIFWMARAWYDIRDAEGLTEHGVLSPRELEHLLTARDFLLRCRTGLHLESGRGVDRLSFELQMALTECMGYQPAEGRPAVEVFMKDYFRHAGRLARVSGLLTMHFDELLNPRLFSWKKDIGDGFTLQGDRVGIAHERVFQEDRLRLLRIFHIAQEGRRRLSSTALRQIREDVLLIDDDFRRHPDAREHFMAILRAKRNVHWTLKEMNDTGVLGRYIPEFRHVVGLGQFNRYHAYTVDEHTIRAVGEARNFIHGERPQRLDLAAEVIYKIHRPELLYLALLFHDIAKGMPGDHSHNGAMLARRFCQRMELNVDASALVEWLVREHLTMAVTSQRCDLSDPEVIRKFADLVGDAGRLDYLLLLTVADIAAVGPNVWNDWKGTLLRELYQATQRYFRGDHIRSKSAEEMLKIRVQAARDKLSLDETLLDKAVSLIPRRCLTHFPPHQLAQIMELIVASQGRRRVASWVDSKRCETLIMVVTDERPGLLATLADVMSSGHVSIIAAQAFELYDGRALDVFHVQSADGQAFDEATDLQRIEKRICNILDEYQGLQEPRSIRHRKHILMEHVPVRVRHLPEASSRQTAIEVSTADHPGLLARLTYTISREGYNIRNAAISTFGERAVDVFFLVGKDGQPLTTEEMQQLLVRLEQAARLPEAA